MLCNEKDEDLDNIFFQCLFNLFIWKCVMEACGKRYVSQPWTSFVKHVAIARRKDNLQNLMRNLCLTIVVYANWKEKK